MRIQNSNAANAPQARQERLRFVETILLWEGIVRRQRVRDAFGVNVNHVTKDLRYYQQQFPDALDYRPEQRGYVAGPKFKPRFASESPAEYLGLLQARIEAESAALVPIVGGQDLPMASLPSPAIGVDKEVLRQVVRAIRHADGITVTYHSMTESKTSRRAIWPHALINTGLRWYVRAFDGTTRAFRSFVLSRIEQAKPQSERPPAGSGQDQDQAWNRSVTANVIPNPALSAHQQAVVAREFGMQPSAKGWVWEVTLRQCLVGHFARRYGLDDSAPRSAQSNWLALRNRASLQPFFLPAGNETN
ncbi:MAG: WYL domain-containing protein [Rhodocyclaceae bacterium]|nr:MAG: WYL domain-containing protein [Rhodocyclaceae bacterium]